MIEILEKMLVKEFVGPILTVCFSILIYSGIKKVTRKIIETKMRFGDEKKAKTILVLSNNIVKYFILIIDVLVVLEIFNIDTKTIVASLGVVGVVAGLALQDTLKDFFAGIFILFENQYKLGDTITINGFTGEVISLGMKTTKIKSYTGEVKMVSNRSITEVTNHSVYNAVALVDVPIGYMEDTVVVEKILKKACQQLSKELPDLTGKIEVLGIEKMEDSALVYRIAAPCKPMMQYGLQRELRKKIKKILEFNKISFSYTQVVMHNG